jgi:hypothetical protein
MFQEMFAQPKLIALFGMMGSDKSWFISKLVGRSVNSWNSTSSGGHRIPCPTDDRFLPTGTETVNHYNFSFEGQEIILIDIEMSDSNNLKPIAGLLKESYEHDVLLSGVIYFHPIIRPQLDGPAERCFNMFQELCGDNAFKNVVLAISLWEWWTVAEEMEWDYVEHEQEF